MYGGGSEDAYDVPSTQNVAIFELRTTTMCVTIPLGQSIEYNVRMNV